MAPRRASVIAVEVAFVLCAVSVITGLALYLFGVQWGLWLAVPPAVASIGLIWTLTLLRRPDDGVQ